MIATFPQRRESPHRGILAPYGASRGAVQPTATRVPRRSVSVLSPPPLHRPRVPGPDGLLGADSLRRRRGGPPRSALRARRVRTGARRRLRWREGGGSSSP